MEQISSGNKESFFIFDERMCSMHVLNPDKESGELKYKCPEVPERTRSIYTFLKGEGLLDYMG
jgi:hypothetical protein